MRDLAPPGGWGGGRSSWYESGGTSGPARARSVDAVIASMVVGRRGVRLLCLGIRTKCECGIYLVVCISGGAQA